MRKVPHLWALVQQGPKDARVGLHSADDLNALQAILPALGASYASATFGNAQEAKRMSSQEIDDWRMLGGGARVESMYLARSHIAQLWIITHKAKMCNRCRVNGANM